MPTITVRKAQVYAQEPGDGSDRTVVVMGGRTFVLDRTAATWLLNDLTSVQVRDCTACGGHGFPLRSPATPCGECNGIGWVR